MYGLPPSTDLSALRGLLLTQVCVGQHEVNLNFEGECRIMVTSTFVMHSGGRETSDRSEILTEFIASLGKAIQSVEWNVAGTVRLRFAGRAATIDILDDEPNYESYEIQFKDRPLIVV
ncbi:MULTISPECIES: DUF6188 family protein [unclassified Actinotalea]|uniref:DUF6188 family protein n=1 Tax=unclassified Actinotalea TaxID=2638618 RepID=UPI0015F6C3E1|nr:MULTISPECIES: DUF6188 family protein [unclassified Actinotalea]